ncbi:hypothetical protein M427DRAFT_434536 [Gonapodya prolifera JEL478]|uniref:Protein kinase domain-containing protein n=1 Tax=Gonapodya prolifera (strain JEL478) TaxID=1344416 RepID=A0A139ATC8_GONPJ|nr:hypothetical protein M427DRAFT_434536 [Gonapodya prolifera JEL478]|eukprot:KXS19969.1 hypothetical protein M427DRAFT_434536 [Gonapodya prolifera JEL478]
MGSVANSSPAGFTRHSSDRRERPSTRGFPTPSSAPSVGSPSQAGLARDLSGGTNAANHRSSSVAPESNSRGQTDETMSHVSPATWDTTTSSRPRPAHSSLSTVAAVALSQMTEYNRPVSDTLDKSEHSHSYDTKWPAGQSSTWHPTIASTSSTRSLLTSLFTSLPVEDKKAEDPISGSPGLEKVEGTSVNQPLLSEVRTPPTSVVPLSITPGSILEDILQEGVDSSIDDGSDECKSSIRSHRSSEPDTEALGEQMWHLEGVETKTSKPPADDVSFPLSYPATNAPPHATSIANVDIDSMSLSTVDTRHATALVSSRRIPPPPTQSTSLAEAAEPLDYCNSFGSISLMKSVNSRKGKDRTSMSSTGVHDQADLHSRPSSLQSESPLDASRNGSGFLRRTSDTPERRPSKHLSRSPKPLPTPPIPVRSVRTASSVELSLHTVDEAAQAEEEPPFGSITPSILIQREMEEQPLPMDDGESRNEDFRVMGEFETRPHISSVSETGERGAILRRRYSLERKSFVESITEPWQESPVATSLGDTLVAAPQNPTMTSDTPALLNVSSASTSMAKKNPSETKQGIPSLAGDGVTDLKGSARLEKGEPQIESEFFAIFDPLNRVIAPTSEELVRCLDSVETDSALPISSSVGTSPQDITSPADSTRGLLRSQNWPILLRQLPFNLKLPNFSSRPKTSAGTGKPASMLRIPLPSLTGMEKIGEGTFSIVYKAKWVVKTSPREERDVAVKMLKLERMEENRDVSIHAPR